MSKKDYVKFAEIIKEARTMKGSAILDYVTTEIAKTFRNDNSAFRPVQFFTACGYDLQEADRMRAQL